MEQKAWKSWFFCLPAILIILFITVYPLYRTLFFSFTNAKLTQIDSVKWIGFQNFIDLITDPDWWKSVKNTILFTFFSVSIETILGLIFALIINRPHRGQRLLQLSILIPWAIPALVTAKIWAWMLNDFYGILNEILLNLGLITHKIAWLADERLTLITIIIVDVWKTTPFMTLLILAGLQGIPKSVMEAATLEGVSPFQRFYYIILPWIKPALWIAVIFRTLDALRVFDLPYVLTSNSKSTAVISTYVRQQLVDFQEIGFGSAASFAVFCMIGLVALIYIRTGQSTLRIQI